MPVAAISDEDFKDWRICNRINSAFSTPFDNELVTICIKCGTEIPAGTLPYRSLFISHAVESSCSHLRAGSLCNDCDMDMVFKVTRGEETCFDQGCDAVLTVDKSMISTALAKFPGKLLADYLAILGNECIICTEIVSRSTRCATGECIHEANVCDGCLKQMIDALVESNQWNSLLCPQSGCRAQLQLEDILAFGSPASYEMYEQQQLQRTLKDIPGYMECKRGTGLCSSGQIHVPADSQPKMICTKCNFASCFTCRIPWHENQTCAQYQFLLNDGESEEYKRKYCKRCPRSGCGAPTKKYKACHEMECANVRECRTSWCWDCKVILDNSVGYAERAKSQHLSSCTAPVVVAKKSQTGYKSIPMPSASDGRYRNGWNEDLGFVGTGDEY